MTTHIATVGKETGHVIAAFKHYRIDKLVLITSKEFQLKAIEFRDKVAFLKIQTMIDVVDPFSKTAYSGIVNKIIEYSKKEANSENIYINITGGTNLMSSAGLTAAQFIGANAYYLIKGKSNDEVIEVPILKISLKDALSGKQKKIFDILYREIKKTGEISNVNAFSKEYNLYKQKMNFYLRQFEKLDLIRVDRKNRENRISLTQTGELLKQLL